VDIVRQIGERYRIENIPYNHLNMDHANLEAFLGARLYSIFEENGFLGLSDIVNRKTRSGASSNGSLGAAPRWLSYS
jgi:hypothetical protein